MVIVADTSPLNYLTLIGEIELLPRIYGQIVIPVAVLRELQQPGAPALVMEWAARLPQWIETRSAPEWFVSDPLLDKLGKGERDAILIAQQVSDEPTLLLIDEGAGRRAATRWQLPLTGTLGVLRAAAQNGWADLPDCIARLRRTNFRVPQSLVATLLREDAERKNAPQ